MYSNNLKIVQGTKVLWEGTIREVAFEIGYILGVDDSWSDAEERGKAITAQMIEDWLQEMAAQGRIERIDPLTFIQTFEAGLVPEIDYQIKKATGHTRWISDIPSTQFVDEKILAEQQPKPAQHSLELKAVSLTFDATASQERAVRILRAYEELMVFEHQANGDWSCLHGDKSYTIYVDTQKCLGYCTCQDFQQRGMQSGMPCKHIYAFLLQDGKIVKEVIQNGRKQDIR